MRNYNSQQAVQEIFTSSNDRRYVYHDVELQTTNDFSNNSNYSVATYSYSCLDRERLFQHSPVVTACVVPEKSINSFMLVISHTTQYNIDTPIYLPIIVNKQFTT